VLRRTLATVLTLAISAGMLATIAAAPAAAALSVHADDTWQVNGVVYAVVQSGNTIYLGGSFTRVSACSPDLSCPTKTLGVSNLAALDATTGEALPGFHPMVTGTDSTVYALAAFGGKLFFGGQFTAVDGTSRRNFAAVDPVTGVLDPNVDAVVGENNGDKVRGMIASSTRLYVSGGFTQVAGASRRHLAAFDAAGNLDAVWRPKTDGQTHTLALTCDGSSVIAGGGFRNAGGPATATQARFGLAMFDATSGALDTWGPVPGQLPDHAPPYDLAVTCDRLFVGTGGSNRIFALDLTDDTGNLLWMLSMFGNAQAVALRGDRLLVGGHFDWVPDIRTGQHVERLHFCVLDLDGHLQNDWVPSFHGRIHTGVWDILVTGSQIYVAGGYTTVSNDRRWGIARFTDV
jgi:hypothetical protein